MGKIFCLPFESKSSPSITFLASILGFDGQELSVKLKDLCSEGYIELDHDYPKLTNKGRSAITVVFAGGSFDIIHPGHIETLEQSKALGDVLIVSVSRDSTFERNKRRKPSFDENIRRKSVAALRCVDAAVLGSETDIFEIVEKIRPDIIALGYDQHHQEKSILQEVTRRGILTRVVRLNSSVPEIKTTKLFSDNPELTKAF